MPINQMLLAELEQEAISARKSLERIPTDKMAWAPHTKSMPMGKLGGHIAEMLMWGAATITTDSFDFAPPGGEQWKPMDPKSTQEILDAWDKGLADFKAALAKATDEDLIKPWSLLMGGKVLFTMPRIVVIRNFTMNHVVHHRAQLGVYLRLNDIPVPEVYGPSADEGQMMGASA